MATCPRRIELRAARKLILEIRQNFLNVGVHAAQIAAFHRGIDIHHGLAVILAEQRRLGVHAQRAPDCPESGASWSRRRRSEYFPATAWCRSCTAGPVPRRCTRMPLAGFTQNDGDDLEAGTERKQNAVGHVLLAQAHGLRPGAVDIQKNRRGRRAIAARARPPRRECAGCGW